MSEPLWISDLYILAKSKRHDFAIDLIYEEVETMLSDSIESVDTLLATIDPNKLSADEVVAFLIITLGAKTLLQHRPEFIDRSRTVLGKEKEDIDYILQGLI